MILKIEQMRFVKEMKGGRISTILLKNNSGREVFNYHSEELKISFLIAKKISHKKTTRSG